MNRKKELVKEIKEPLNTGMVNEKMTSREHLEQSLKALPEMINQVKDDQIDTLRELADSMGSSKPKVTYDNYEEIAEEMANTANGFLSLSILNYIPEDPDQEISNTNMDAYSYAPWEERKRFGDEVQKVYREKIKSFLEKLMKDPDVDLDLDLRSLINAMRVTYAEFMQEKLQMYIH